MINNKFHIGQEIHTDKWHYFIDHISITSNGIKYGGECWDDNFTHTFMLGLKKPMSRFGFDENEMEDIYARPPRNLQSAS